MNIFENLFLSIVRGHQHEELGKVSVSSLTFPCERSVYYSLTVPKQYRGISIHGIIRTWVGTKLHETPILPNGMTEIPLKWEEIYGHADEYSKDEAFLLEKKTTKYIPRDEPRENHKKQVLYYAVLLEKNGYPVSNAGILYINPFDIKFKFYPVELKPINEIADEMLNLKNRLLNAVNYGIPPPRNVVPWEEEGSSLVCEYCSYCQICFGGVK